MRQTTTEQLNHLVPDLGEPSKILHTDLILCRFCHAAITTRHEELVMGGSHQHCFVNPGGYQFHIGCFKLAPGCDISGPATDEFTWFKGYVWQTARCSDCGEHLGWLYQNDSANHQFFGLIIDKLVRYRAP